MPTHDALETRLEEKLHREIPIARQMGFTVTRVGTDGADCLLPLRPNTNHLGTQFGGSLYAAGALSCYTALLGLLARLGQETKNIVITDGQIRYLSPGTGDVVLQARLPTSELSLFETQLRKKGRARLKIHTQILVGSRLVAEVHGEYLARSTSTP